MLLVKLKKKSYNKKGKFPLSTVESIYDTDRLLHLFLNLALGGFELMSFTLLRFNSVKQPHCHWIGDWVVL
jgi:hypothetical protein